MTVSMTVWLKSLENCLDTTNSQVEVEADKEQHDSSWIFLFMVSNPGGF